MSDFYSIITTRGLEKQTAALASGSQINLRTVAFGDADYNPQGFESSLQSEVHRTHITRIAPDPADKNTLIIEAIISGDIGGFWIREVGVFDSDGDLFAVGKYPATYKPVLEDGAVKDIAVRMLLKFDNASNITLIYNSGLGGSGGGGTNLLSLTDYGSIKIDVPFSTENRPKFEFDFAVDDLSFDCGTLRN